MGLVTKGYLDPIHIHRPHDKKLLEKVVHSK